MFDRPHHRRIARLLGMIDPAVMAQTDCAFAGGTYISMKLGEFRRSDDLDIICMSAEGYARLRDLLADDPSALFTREMTFVRDLRMDPYRFHGFIEVDGAPVKLEVFSERRIAVSAEIDERLGLPCLSVPDLYAEKLLACSDRVLDKSTNSRDIIDLAMMIREWGPIPDSSLDKAVTAYGKAVVASFRKGLGLLQDPRYLNKALTDLDMELSLGAGIVETLEEAAIAIASDTAEITERDRRILAAGGLDGSPADPFVFGGGIGQAFLQALAESREKASAISWPCVERATIERAIFEIGAEAHEVADFLTAHSPGAVYPERSAAILGIAERRQAVRADIGDDAGPSGTKG